MWISLKQQVLFFLPPRPSLQGLANSCERACNHLPSPGQQLSIQTHWTLTSVSSACDVFMLLVRHRALLTRLDRRQPLPFKKLRVKQRRKNNSNNLGERDQNIFLCLFRWIPVVTVQLQWQITTSWITKSTLSGRKASSYRSQTPTTGAGVFFCRGFNKIPHQKQENTAWSTVTHLSLFQLRRPTQNFSNNFTRTAPEHTKSESVHVEQNNTAQIFHLP